MRKIRVLVVDDSVVIRKLLTEILSEHPMIEVVGSAANGRIALSKLSQVTPDLVTLDVEMPEMNGLETLAALRKTHPRLPVIMFSTLTAPGAAATLDALALGANDYVPKPANVGSVAAGMQRIRDDLIPKIKVFCAEVLGGERQASGVRRQALGSSPHPSLQVLDARRKTLDARRLTPAQRVDVVAIGVSTGGPNALATVLPQIPAGFPVPIVLVQHMPPSFS
jgi:two-component system chemotaxis response regulator CheB